VAIAAVNVVLLQRILGRIKMPKTDYTKLRTKVLGIIEGLALSNPEYNKLRKLLILCEQVHSGSRKDGSKEFSHQLEMIAFALTYHTQLESPLEVYLAILIHDVIEDYPGMRLAIERDFPEELKYSDRLSKFKDPDGGYGLYFANLSTCPICSIAKLIDRVHNLSTAPGVFKTAKILEYCKETEQYYFELIRMCKENFTNRNVYENLKFILTTQVNTIQSLVPQEQTEVYQTSIELYKLNTIKVDKDE
jgi:(p)ppGpp synthase/HD superfamily hydrolase